MLSLKFLWYVFRNMVDICYTFGEREGNKFPPFRWITGPSKTGSQGGFNFLRSTFNLHRRVKSKNQSIKFPEYYLVQRSKTFFLPKTMNYYLTSDVTGNLRKPSCEFPDLSGPDNSVVDGAGATHQDNNNNHLSHVTWLPTRTDTS